MKLKLGEMEVGKTVDMHLQGLLAGHCPFCGDHDRKRCGFKGSNISLSANTVTIDNICKRWVLKAGEKVQFAEQPTDAFPHPKEKRDLRDGDEFVVDRVFLGLDNWLYYSYMCALDLEPYDHTMYSWRTRPVEQKIAQCTCASRTLLLSGCVCGFMK